MTPLPTLRSQLLVRIREPYGNPASVSEVEQDGVRALAYIEGGA